jgi:hypothetical protein
MTSQRISRRTVLRDTSAMIALPWLNAMLPRTARASAESTAPKRMVCVYTPNGVCNEQWYPKKYGADFEFSPILSPLKPLRDQVSVLSGLCHLNHAGRHGHNGADVFLTGADLYEGGAVYHNTISVDQYAARRVGGATRFNSMVLSHRNGAGPQLKTWTISFNELGNPIPAMNDPHAIFNRLFVPDTPEARQAQLERFRLNQSVLDQVLEQASSLERRLGQDDQRKLREYLESVRTVEQSVERDRAWLDKPKPQLSADSLEIPLDVDQESSRTEYLRTMYGLIALALETDSTRVVSFMTGAEGSPGGGWPEFGKDYHWHRVQHHSGGEASLQRMAEIDTRQIELLTEFLQRLATIREGTSNMLDRTVVFYGSGMNNGDGFERGGGAHNTTKLPILMAGGRGLGIKHGQHLFFPDDKTPLTNVFVTMLQSVGIETDRFSDATGTLNGLS